jgi:7,8-dihydropterin-6-yl-methyl-4-(beta-D-ribofuranosyl)aminobenzene 5'-phosphate synthase
MDALGCLESANVTILLEDTIGFDTPFMGRFGLSLLLELKSHSLEKCILFDTNSEPAPMFHNLNILEKSLNDISTIFLSHCHYDHTDGLAGVIAAINHPVPVIAHPDIFRPCFEINPDGIRHIGIVGQSKDDFERAGAIFTLARSPLSLMQGVVTTGEIERVTSFELLENLYTICDGEVVQDHERDDTALILNLKDGLVVITGCAHAGIVNTLMHARKITGIDKVYAVMGGLHLLDANEERIQKSVEALKDVDWVFAGHCTGLKGLMRIAEAKGDRFEQIHTGAVINLPVDGEHPVSYLSTQKRDLHRRLIKT